MHIFTPISRFTLSRNLRFPMPPIRRDYSARGARVKFTVRKPSRNFPQSELTRYCSRPAARWDVVPPGFIRFHFDSSAAVNLKFVEPKQSVFFSFSALSQSKEDASWKGVRSEICWLLPVGSSRAVVMLTGSSILRWFRCRRSAKQSFYELFGKFLHLHRFHKWSGFTNLGSSGHILCFSPCAHRGKQKPFVAACPPSRCRRLIFRLCSQKVH